ncbi:endolytic transglycosylase MltG [Streptomyces sp. ATCC51928]|uniref:Endolytic murein transglycosylase n=1 Tax=Streptomyces caviscabies TaxID=90079 RepID=A0ABW2MMW1_9ACTN|nr:MULTISPECIES: endolytic transglycosylase MltG [unclassified Streptomyces]MDX3505686.1 endolytic transglycosylase MltG [Streptomyces sp. ATCC51928]MDX5525109.1 endolytic transglycosylase MltG [Streptomyces sp. DE06-01C]
MTEYGRGPGSEPWHPEDPLYGDQGWGGQQAAHGQGQYGDQQQSYPQDPYAQQYQNHQQYPQQPYDQQQHQQYGQQPQQNHQQYGAPQQDPYAQQQGAQPQYNGGWDTGQQTAMPYGAEPQDPYAQQPGGYDATQDYYGTPEAYPPPQPPGRREAAPEQQQHQQQPSTDWDPDEPQEETHPFFTGADDPAGREPRDGDEDPDDDGSRASRRGGKTKKKKSRSGCACLVVSVVLLGGLGGVSYVGYSFWKKQFGAPADFAGTGSGEVEVEIPEGSLGYDIANILRKKGVIKSSDAFVAAQNDNPKGKLLQAGVYLLKKEMSAASAIDLMLDPKSQNAFVIPEGTRNVKVYEMIDKRLELKEGTTAKVAKTKAESLGLPDWADDNPDVKDPLEGFLYPAAYPVPKGSKPEDALKRMVARANKEYENVDLEATAKKYNLDGPWQVLTVASLVQAEGLTHDDFRKMAEVVYNRLEPDNTITNRKLEFDSAFNYLKNQSKITIGSKEIRTNPDPYNTYYHKGLPPGPISNPGMDAIKASLNPTTNGWMFFISLDGKKTDFTKTVEEHEKLNEKWKEQQGLG